MKDRWRQHELIREVVAVYLYTAISLERTHSMIKRSLIQHPTTRHADRNKDNTRRVPTSRSLSSGPAPRSTARAAARASPSWSCRWDWEREAASPAASAPNASRLLPPQPSSSHAASSRRPVHPFPEGEAAGDHVLALPPRRMPAGARGG